MVLTWTRLPPLSTRLQTILDESYSREPITPISNEEQSGESPPPLSLDSCATYSLSDILGCAQNSTNPNDKIETFVAVNRSIGQCFTDLNSQSRMFAGSSIRSQQNSIPSGTIISLSKWFHKPLLKCRLRYQGHPFLEWGPK